MIEKFRLPELSPHENAALKVQPVGHRSLFSDHRVHFPRPVGVEGAPEKGEKRNVLGYPEAENSPSDGPGEPDPPVKEEERGCKEENRGDLEEGVSRCSSPRAGPPRRVAAPPPTSIA